MPGTDFEGGSCLINSNAQASFVKHVALRLGVTPSSYICFGVTLFFLQETE